MSKRKQQRAVVITDKEGMMELLHWQQSPSGMPVTQRSILALPFFWGAINLVANKVGVCPVNVYKISRNGSREVDHDHPAQRLLKRGSGTLTPMTFKSCVQAHALSAGNGYAAIFRNPQTGDPEDWVILNSESTAPGKENGQLKYVTVIEGKSYTIEPENILHIPGLSVSTLGMQGESLVNVGKEVFGTGMAIQRYTSTFFVNGAHSQLVVELPVGLKDPEKIKRFRESFQTIQGGLNNSHKTILLEDGAKATRLAADNDAIQLKELTEQQAIAIANLIGCPPSYLGVTSGYTSYNSLEQESKRFLSDCLNRWLVQWEEQLSMKLLREREIDEGTHYIEFNRKALLETDSKTEAEVMLMYTNNNMMAWEEGRERLNMSTTKKGTWFRSNNTAVVDSETFQALPAIQPPPPPAPPQAAGSPEAAPADDPVKEQPKADTEQSERFRKLTEKTVERLIHRVRKSVESGEVRTEGHREIFLESLDVFPAGEEVTERFFQTLNDELSAICREDRSKINWRSYAEEMTRGLA